MTQLRTRPADNPNMTANDNAPPLPTPVGFSTLLARLLRAYGRMMDDKNDRDAWREMEALRMQVIDIYERACPR
jgi:hypothetical protein